MIGIFLINGRRSAVTYAAPATVTASSIDADLGSLGRISVTRTTTGETRTVRAGCKPESTKQVETENYEGTIEFHGEEGFADVSATRAPLVHEIVCTCRSGADGTGPAEKELPGARLDVERHVGHRIPGRVRRDPEPSGRPDRRQRGSRGTSRRDRDPPRNLDPGKRRCVALRPAPADRDGKAARSLRRPRQLRRRCASCQAVERKPDGRPPRARRPTGDRPGLQGRTCAPALIPCQLEGRPDRRSARGGTRTRKSPRGQRLLRAPLLPVSPPGQADGSRAVPVGSRAWRSTGGG